MEVLRVVYYSSFSSRFITIAQGVLDGNPVKFEQHSQSLEESHLSADATCGTDELRRQYGALLVQVADERHAFSEVRKGVENLRSETTTVLHELQEAKSIVEGCQRLQIGLTSTELRLSNLEHQAQTIAAALNSIEGILQQQRQVVAENQRLIEEFLSVVKHPQVIKLLRGALKLKNFKQHLRLRSRAFDKDSAKS